MSSQSAGNRKFKVTVSGGHVLCGDNSRMYVTHRTGPTRYHTLSSKSTIAEITGPDQLISSIPYTVYSQLSALLTRDHINIAARLFNLTLEEAMLLRDNADHAWQRMDAIFQLMKERNLNLGHLVEVLMEMKRYDALSVLIKAGYPDHPNLYPSVSEEESIEEVTDNPTLSSSETSPVSLSHLEDRTNSKD